MLAHTSYTFVMIRWLIGAGVLSSCLSIPAETQIDGCDISEYGSTEFLPTAQLQIREAISADINGDGCVDLLLSDTNEAGGGYGVYIFLGPQPSGELNYHAFVPTTIRPLAMNIADLSGTATIDFMVFGPRSDDEAGVIEVFEVELEETQVSATQVAQRESSFAPAMGGSLPYEVPVHIISGDFDNNGTAYDIVVADLTNLERYIIPDTIVELANSTADLNTSMWSNINKLLVHADADGDDLAVVELQNLTWIPTGGSAQQMQALTGPNMFTALQIDLDGMAPLDIIGGDAVSLVSHQLAGSPPTIQSSDTVAVGGNYWSMAILPRELGGQDLVAFDRTPTTQLTLIGNLGLNGRQLTRNAPRTIPLSGIDPIAAQAMDFDADGVVELRVFGTSGVSQCFLPDASDGLVLCP